MGSFSSHGFAFRVVPQIASSLGDSSKQIETVIFFGHFHEFPTEILTDQTFEARRLLKHPVIILLDQSRLRRLRPAQHSSTLCVIKFC